jgi:hypothetical protein
MRGSEGGAEGKEGIRKKERRKYKVQQDGVF